MSIENISWVYFLICPIYIYLSASQFVWNLKTILLWCSTRQFQRIFVKRKFNWMPHILLIIYQVTRVTAAAGRLMTVSVPSWLNSFSICNSTICVPSSSCAIPTTFAYLTTIPVIPWIGSIRAVLKKNTRYHTQKLLGVE